MLDHVPRCSIRARTPLAVFKKWRRQQPIVRCVQVMLQSVAESGSDTVFLQRLVYGSCVVFLVNTNAGDEHGRYEQN